MAGIFGKAVTRGGEVHAVSEQPAQVAHFLAEPRGRCVGIAVGMEEQRMSALHADIIVVTVANRETFVGVVAEEAGERVTHMCQ